MTLPASATKANLDSSTDDPKLARAELADLVDKFNALLTHLGLSSILSTPLTVGNGLINNAGALEARASSTTQTGIAELATDAEAAAKTDTARVLTPSNLAALAASDTFAGLIEIATNAEATTGTDTGRAITPASLAAVLAAFSAGVTAVTGTNGITVTPTTGSPVVSMNTNNPGGIGAFFIGFNNSASTITNGSTIAGSDLAYASFKTTVTNEITKISAGLSGTWRNVSSISLITPNSSTSGGIGIWIRTA